LAPGSIAGIEALDSAFLRQWGDRKDSMYYMTEFGSLKKMEGESVSDFSKIFNKMYNKIPAKIKPSETSTSRSSVPHPQVDELTKMVKSLSTEMERMKVEGRQSYKGPQNAENKGGFRRPNNFTPPNVQRERGRDREDQKIQAPF
jgi:hypothetical protein